MKYLVLAFEDRMELFLIVFILKGFHRIGSTYSSTQFFETIRKSISVFPICFVHYTLAKDRFFMANFRSIARTAPLHSFPMWLCSRRPGCLCLKTMEVEARAAVAQNLASPSAQKEDSLCRSDRQNEWSNCATAPKVC